MSAETVEVIRFIVAGILIAAVLFGISWLSESMKSDKEDSSDTDKCTARFYRTRRYFFKD